MKGAFIEDGLNKDALNKDTLDKDVKKEVSEN
ncbi:MAG: hypothetical protein ACJAYR_000643 [Sneathiella sp.]